MLDGVEEMARVSSSKPAGWSDDPNDANDYAEARARGATNAMFNAASVRFDDATSTLAITLHSGVEVVLPLASLPLYLRDAAPVDLGTFELLGLGSGIHWPALDVTMGVSVMIREAIGAFEGQKRGGRAKSEAKTAAVRENGKKGGRPRRGIPS